jgi:hypothetical protein
MSWTERIIGVGMSVLITAGLLLAAVYGPFYLTGYFRQISPYRISGFINAAAGLLFVGRVVRATSTGSIKTKGFLGSVDRAARPVRFWCYVALDGLMIAVFGYLALRSFVN